MAKGPDLFNKHWLTFTLNFARSNFKEILWEIKACIKS